MNEREIFILEIVNQEIKWETPHSSFSLSKRESEAFSTGVLNIKGRLRVRIKELLDSLVESAEQDGEERANENREPPIKWSDRD